MGESSSSDSDEEFRSTALDLDFGAESEMSEESVSEPSENIWSRVRRECERRCGENVGILCWFRIHNF